MKALYIATLSAVLLTLFAAVYAGAILAVYTLLNALVESLLANQHPEHKPLPDQAPTMTLPADGPELRNWARERHARENPLSRGQTPAPPILVVLIKNPSSRGHRANSRAEAGKP